MHSRFLRIFQPILIAMTLLLSACGGGSGGSSTPATPPEGVNAAVVKSVPFGAESYADTLITTQCGSAGGIAIYTGIDTNSNGVLDTTERTGDPYVLCNGSSGYSAQELPEGDTTCPLGGIKLDVGTITKYFCNESSTQTTPSAFTQNGTIKGKLNLPNQAAAPALFSIERILKAVTRSEGGLWLTPEKVQACIDEDQKALVAGKDSVPQPITKPIKVTIQPDNSYEIPDVPSGNYSLVYIDDTQTEGTKIDDIYVAPAQTTTKDITEVKPTGSITLSVASLSLGTKIEGATIRLNELDLTTTSETNGTAGFSALPEGTYSITVSKDGYVSQYMTFRVTSNQTTDLQTIELNSQKGRLVGSLSANGVDDYSNIIVYAKSADGSLYTTLTDSNGNYTFPALPVADGYSVLAYAHDYASSKVDGINIANAQTATADSIVLTRLIYQTTAQSSTPTIGGSIVGFARFSDVDDSLNHAGIIVSIEGSDYEAITARDGSFVLNDIPEGDYTINITDSNHITQTKAITILTGAATYVDDISLSSKVGQIRGVVQDTTGAKVANATITLVDNGLSSISDENGTFVLSNVPIGLHLFSVQKDGYSSAKFEATIQINTTTDRTALPVVLTKQVLVGSVSKGEGATDHSGIAVNVVGAGLYATSDASGNFSINGIPSGDIVLEYSADGFKTEVLLYNVTNNGFNVPLQTMQSARISDATLSLNANAVVTNNPRVNLAIDATSAYKMMISETLDFVNANLLDYVSSYDYNLSASNGVKTLYVKLYDASASEATKVILSDSIILDTQKPRLGDMLLQTGSFYTNTANVKVRVTTDDGSNIAFVKLFDTLTGSYKTFAYNTNGIDWTLPSTTDQQIKIKLVDEAGNEGDESIRNIVFDTTPPTFESVTIIGKSVVRDEVLLSLTSNELYAAVEISQNPNFSFATKYAYGEDLRYTLSGVDGAKTLYVRVLDDALNASTAKSVEVVLDTTSPTTPSLVTTNGMTNETTYEVAIKTPSSDANFAGYEYSINSSSYILVPNSQSITKFNVVLSTSQTNSIRVRGVDAAGNTSEPAIAYITHDPSALVTKATPSAGFYNSDVTISLSALGAKNIYYTTDGSTPTTSSTVFNSNNPIVLSSEKKHTLRYFSIDDNGNKEIVKTSEYTIDKTKPLIAFAAHEALYNSYPDLSITTTDATNVALRYEISNNGSSPQDPSETSAVSYAGIPVKVDGSVVKVKVMGVDEAGNQSDIMETTLRVDTQKPTIASDDNGGVYPAQNGKVVKLSTTDLQDAAPKIYYTLDGTTPTQTSILYSGDFNLSSVGVYNLQAIAVDDLGNKSAILARTYRLSTIYNSTNSVIDTDTVWTKANSPYSLEADVYVKNGAKLTIEPGVEITVKNYAGLRVESGSIVAIATAEEPIKYLGVDSSYTEGIYFFDGSVDATYNDDGSYASGSTIQHMQISNIYATALHAHTSSPYFANITIQNAEYGLNFYNSNSHAKTIDINTTKQDGVIAAGGSANNVTLEDITIANYASNAIEARDAGTTINITKSDIAYVEGKKMFMTNYYTSNGTINATQNYYHTYNLDILDGAMSGLNIIYAPMLSGPIATADFDSDSILDINDADDDNDKYTDADEANAHTSQFLASGVGLPADFDGDFISDATDPDDDNDGFKDVDELAVGANPKDASSIFEIVDAQELTTDTTLPQTTGVDTLLIKGNVIIPLGKTLTIKEGTKIIVGGNYSVQVHGAIKLLGSADKRITITPKLPSSEWANNHFDGLVFYDDSTPLVVDANNNYVSGSIVQYTDISYGGAVVATMYKTTPTKTDGFAYIDNVTIDHSKFDAIQINGITKVVVKESNITNTGSTSAHEVIYANNSGIVMSNSHASATAGEVFEVYSSNVELNDNNFSNNPNYTTLWARSSTVTAQRNSFYNTKAAYYLESGDTLTANNDTMDAINPSTTYNGAIAVVGGSKATITNLDLKKSNYHGIYANTAANVIISDSNISNSAQQGYYNNSNGTTNVRGCRFTNNLSGITLYYAYFAKIEDNNISNNTNSGLVIDGMQSGGFELISQNTITNNGDYGLRTNTSPEIVFNTITANTNGGLYLDGDNAKPVIKYNNIYANSTIADGDNTSFDIKNQRTLDLVLENNYHGTLDGQLLFYYNFDKLDDSTKGRIYFDAPLYTAVDITNKTSQDFDGDGIADIYDFDDDNDGIVDRVEADTNNGEFSPYDASDANNTLTTIDTDRDGVLDDEDSDDDNDGVSDTDEATYGTNPNVADSDGDGVSDGDEISSGSNPLAKDSLGGVLYKDTIITSDTYVKDLVIPTGVTLSSNNGSTIYARNTITLKGGEIKNIFINGMGTDTGYAAVTITTPTVARGLDIQNAYIGIAANASLELYDSHIENINTAISIPAANATIENTSFKNGVTAISAPYVSSSYNTIILRRSEISDFSSYGIYVDRISSSMNLTVSNTLFRNNNQAIRFYDSSSDTSYLTVKQSTFDANNIAINREYSYYDYTRTTTTDSLFTNNNVALNAFGSYDTHTNNVFYANNSGTFDSTETKEQVVTANPFKASLIGYTTSAATTDATSTTLSDTTLNLTTNELAGVFMQADATSGAKYKILSNTQNTITIEGVLSGSSLDANTSYSITDYNPHATSVARTASSTGGVVGAFDGVNDPYWSYMIYTDATPTTNGMATSNEIWRGTITLDGSVTFGALQHLRIERGTKVIFAEDNTSQSLTINSIGGIQAQVHKDSWITFTSNDETNTSKGQWGGIVLNSFANLTNIKIEKATTAIENNAPLKAINLDITNSTTGIQADSTLNLYDSHIENINTAISIPAANATIENTSFKNGVTAISAPFGDYTYNTITLRRSEISDFSSYGIYVDRISSSMNLTVSNTLFRNNNQAIRFYDSSSDTSYLTVKQSTFDANNIAINRESSGLDYIRTTTTDSLFTNNNVALNAFGSYDTHTNNVYYGNKSGEYSSATELITGNPYVNRYIGNLHVADAHTAKTAASDGGEVGVYGGGVGAILTWIVYSDPGITPEASRTRFGEIATNEYWDGNNTLAGDITIPKGKILKIEAGSNLLFPSGNKLVVEGELELLGTNGNEVVLDSSSATPNSESWDGVKIKSVGGTYEYMIVQHAANGIDTTGSTAVTLSHVKVIDANVTAITATGGAVVEDSSIWGTLDEGGNSVGVKIAGDATVRRNLITNTKTAISMSGLTTQAIDINHNILANNGVGIYSYYNTTSNYPRAQIFYNTIDGSATYGINMNNNGNSVKYNIITNSGTSAINATNNYDTSVNAFYGNTADYSGGIADMASAYANLSEDPSYTSVSQSITAENIGHGIYGDLLNVDNYKTTNPTYATYTPYSSRMGAYNLIAYVDTNITQDRSDVQRAYSESFVKDGMSLSGTIKTAMKNMDITIDSTNLDSTASSINVVKNGYEQSYTLTIGSDNSVADGNHTINIAVVDIVDATVANNVDYGVFNLDNSGPTLSLVDYVNDTNVTQNQTIHFAISDALVGAREYQFSTDGGVNWTEGDAHLVLTSAGENDGNTADISFDSVNVVNGEFGFNVVEINSSDFSLVSTSAQTFSATNVDAFTSYLNALADGTTIAFVVKQNGRDTDATRHNNLMAALAKFGFNGTFSTYDSVAFIGQKGLKKIHAITKIVPSGSGIAQINLTTEYGIANSAFTIDSCYNQDVDFTCHIKARGIDYLGNVGSVFDVNYKIAQ